MKHTSMLRSFLLTVAFAIVVGVALATGCDTSLLQTTAGKAGNDAQTTILDERARQEALETEVKAQTLPDQVAARKMRIWAMTIVLVLAVLVLLVLFALWAWHKLHTHKAGADGQYPILVRNSVRAALHGGQPDITDLNQVPSANWNPADKVSEEDQRRINDQVQRTRFGIGITRGNTTMNPAQALGYAVQEGLRNRLAPPRDVHEIPQEMAGQIIDGQARRLEDGL
jgi:hypothetical protein